jgi:hypothetical protein
VWFDLNSVKLEQIDRKQDHVKKKHRIDVSQQSIENEKDVAQKCESSKGHDRRHAEADKNAKGSRETEQIDPRHARSFRIRSLVWTSHGIS